MQHNVYKDLYIKENYSVFEFFSVGKRGVIAKRIVFEPTDYHDVYNLIFGDIDINNEIDDYNISDNGDRNKVLATLTHAIDMYLNTYPERIIFFSGSTAGRTRLYRMAINLNLEYLSEKFEIYCQVDNRITMFEKNIEVKGFLIRKKT
ncbi:hypothetical protein [Chitinophaga sp.]|uniref:DUF6934 family protein n=1 Tax=Chitinophaga sp. TaxID=1869181 RepID=UPI0031DBC7B1